MNVNKLQSKWVYSTLLALIMVASSSLVIAPIPQVHAPAAGGCPDFRTIGNFLPADDITATFTPDGTSTTVTYTVSVPDESSEFVSTGIPGLIGYCVYPSQPPGNPSSATASATGDDGNAWTTFFKTVQGYFEFVRQNPGDPTNIGFTTANNVASPITVGTATWPTGTAPTAQTILLHINDPDLCQALYGDTETGCFVTSGPSFPHPAACPNNEVACKSVTIDQAITTTPLTVPVGTFLNIHYVYVIENTLGTGASMYFYIPSSKTTDINTGGGKDYFGCEQAPDSGGFPGAGGLYANYFATGFQLNLKITADKAKCQQSNFFLTAYTGSPALVACPNTFPAPKTASTPSSCIVLAPGQSITFQIDMVTRRNPAGKQEYTTCGLHVLNSGFTVKWIESDDGLLHSFSTNLTPISVNVVGC